MKIVRESLAQLERCYANSVLQAGGRTQYLFASELDRPCYAFDAITHERETIWEHPGGTMAIVPLKDRDGEFLAVQNFKPKMMAPDTEIVWVRKNAEGRWVVSTLAKEGYIHRFDVLHGDKDYLLVCTIASHKDCLEDWTSPGKLWACPLPKNLSRSVGLSSIKEGLMRNHGYLHTRINGKETGVVASDEGVMNVTPPQFEGDDWHFENIMKRPVSDLALLDIDGDGQMELASIEPLHGNIFNISKRNGEIWQTVYTYTGDFRLGHVVWGGQLRGTPTFIGGAREGAGELFAVQYDKSRFTCTLLDAHRGPANITVINGDSEDTLLVSNREIGEAAIYHIFD